MPNTSDKGEGFDFGQFAPKEPKKGLKSASSITSTVSPVSTVSRVTRESKEAKIIIELEKQLSKLDKKYENVTKDQDQFRLEWATQLMMLQNELKPVPLFQQLITKLQEQINVLQIRSEVGQRSTPERKKLLAKALSLVTLLRSRTRKTLQAKGFKTTTEVGNTLEALLVEALG